MMTLLLPWEMPSIFEPDQVMSFDTSKMLDSLLDDAEFIQLGDDHILQVDFNKMASNEELLDLDETEMEETSQEEIELTVGEPGVKSLSHGRGPSGDSEKPARGAVPKPPTVVPDIYGHLLTRVKQPVATAIQEALTRHHKDKPGKGVSELINISGEATLDVPPRGKITIKHEVLRALETNVFGAKGYQNRPEIRSLCTTGKNRRIFWTRPGMVLIKWKIGWEINTALRSP